MYSAHPGGARVPILLHDSDFTVNSTGTPHKILYCTVLFQTISIKLNYINVKKCFVDYSHVHKHLNCAHPGRSTPIY